MSKLYVFGIGGTGSRVLRSLTMLMSAGVDLSCNGINEIVPIIIDPDVANGDLTRTVTLMNEYYKIHGKLHFTAKTNNRFFKTSIKRALPNYTLYIKDTGDKKFCDFISLPEMSKENKAMMNMLFSEKNLHSQMDEGFKGNPNIGSVVLNQIVDTQEFIDFANDFQQGDKIFIISSIFGGTGASGFPLLLKTLRGNSGIPNHYLIKNAEIGAVTVLPYFKIKQDDDSEIDSSTFISKTKSALAYYERNVAARGQVNALYYLSDSMTNSYENHQGKELQKNDAHLIEFFAATAIVDFCNNSFDLGMTENKELGVNDFSGGLTFNAFDDSLNNMLRRPMVQFTLAANCIKNKLNKIEGIEISHSFPENYFSSEFVRNVKSFIEKYLEWLSEMKSNNRSLNLFNLDCGDKPFEVITGGTVYKVMSAMSNYDLFYGRLNATKKNLNESDDNKFMEMFYLATKKLSEEKFKIK